MAKRPALSLGALAGLCLLALGSCSKDSVKSFPWISAEGERLAFHQKAGFPEGEEGRFPSSREANRFTLTAPTAVPEGRMVEAELEVGEPGADVEFLLGSTAAGGSAKEYRHAFSLPPGRMKVYLPWREGSLEYLGLRRLKPGAAEGQGSLFSLLGLAVAPAFHGFDPGGEGLPARMSSSFDVLDLGKGALRWSIELSSVFDPQSQSLRLSFGPGDGAEVRLGLGGAQVFALPSSAVPRVSSLPIKAFGNLPGSTDPGRGRVFVDVPQGASLKSAYLTGFETGKDSPVDPGCLLHIDLPEGQALDYFFWDANPDVAMLLFKDYATQDAYLKRLAFFVEKKGFVGRLARDEEIAGLHGWNAHDYRAEDLARFFSEAKRLDFPLNPQESWLLSFLESSGTIVRHGSRFSPGKGALISVSQESPPYLRRLFLTHELSHAIFFTDQGYRDLVDRLWASMGKEERYFWLLYFGWMNYDTRSDYLMANELQSYLVQQGLGGVEKYFQETLPGRLLENHPELEKPLKEYMEAYGEEFLAKAKALDEWLKRNYSLRAGTLHRLRKLP